MSKLNVGIIGCGALGVVHAQRLSSLSNVTITAISDPDPAAMHRVAKVLPESMRPPDSFADYRDLLRALGLKVSDHEAARRYYRERAMACVVFTVDAQAATGQPPVPNEEVAQAAAANPDVIIPFASIDPARGAAGVAMARRLVTEHGMRGFHRRVSESLRIQKTLVNVGLVQLVAQLVLRVYDEAAFRSG